MSDAPTEQRVSESSGAASARPRFHPSSGALRRLDEWMMHNPWHPRVAPFVVYIALLAVVSQLRAWLPVSYPIAYTVQCAVVAWLLWRYRRLLPELNMRLHWLALPVGVLVTIAWIWLGMVIDEFDTVRERGLWRFTIDLATFARDPAAATAPTPFVDPNVRSFSDEMGASVSAVALALRLVGMSILVPLFEELFVRSLILRSFGGGRRALRGLAQVLLDIPVLGDALSRTKWGERMGEPAVLFSEEFARMPLGAITVSGFVISSLVFMVSHVPRDYVGTIACAAAYCALLSVTRRKGLGPVVWAHGITNALLWLYTVHTGDWRFL